MKKMNALFAALVLVISAVTPMTSSAISATTGSKSQMTLSRTYSSHYTIYIPDENPTLDAESVDVALSVKGYLEYGEKLTVQVSSHNSWQLRDSNLANENGIAYKMKVGDKEITSEANDVISITSANNNQVMDTKLTFCEFGEAIYAGTYSDQLTFAVKTGEASAGEAIEPTQEATEPTQEATEPTQEATEPTQEATEPTQEATEPTQEATEPTP